MDFEQVEKKKPEKQLMKKPKSSHQKRGVCASGDSITRMEKDYCICMSQQCCSFIIVHKYEKNKEVCESCCFYVDEDEGMPWDKDLMELLD